MAKVMNNYPLKYPGRCACGAYVEANRPVTYDASQKPSIRKCPTCDPSSAQVALPQKPLAIRARVELVKRTSDDGVWSIVSVTLDNEQLEGVQDLPVQFDRPFEVVGNVGKVQQGDLLEIYGAFVPHERYGMQFKASRAVRVVGTSLQSLRAFLAGLPHIGESRAKAIIQTFDNDRQKVLEAIEHRPETLTAVRGITMSRATEIRDAFLAAGNLREVSEWIAGLQVGEALAANILDNWKHEAKSFLIEDPYRLMQLRGVAFKTADEIALSRFRIHPQDVRRAAAAVQYLLKEEENEGHTWTPIEELIGSTGVTPDL